MSTVTIRIPTPLRPSTGGASDVVVEAATVRDALRTLEARFGDLQGRVLAPEGELRGFVNVFVGDTDVRRLAGLDTPLDDGVSISVLPAVAGGAS
jgi:molybdopterin converting factor small subunit